MSRRENIRNRRAEAGFTLLEMLIALVAGAMTIATVYTLGAGSTRAFQEQNRINQTQGAVRSAMEQVRRDVSRAGFGGTPDSGTNASNGDRGANPAGCTVTQAFQLVGLDINDGAYTAQMQLPADNVVQADGIVMTGNYATGDHYLVAQIAGGTAISLQQSRQSFRRSFGSPLDAQRFAEAFQVGRWVYLVSETGRRVARAITGVNGATATVTVSPAITAGCFGYGRGARISPISRIEYYAASPVTDAAFEWLLPRGTAAERTARGVDQAILARREVTFADTTPPTAIANSERVVLEYLVHFNAAITRDTAAAGVPAPNLVETLAGDGGAALLAAAPSRARAVRVTVGARTPGVDPNFVWTGPRASQRASLRSYLPRLPPNSTASTAVGVAPAAHVRTSEEVIMLENIANRGLR